MPHKNVFLTHLSIPQLNQATFDLPGSAIIHPTHTPSLRSSCQNFFYKFGKKITVGVNNVRKILGLVGLGLGLLLVLGLV